MAVDPVEIARKKLEEAVKNKQDKDQKADAAIWAAVAINAGMGVVPLGINIWTFIGVITALVTVLGSIYGYHLTHDGAGKLVRHIFTSVGVAFCMFTFGMKFFVEVLKGVGVITMGGATVAGMALDAMLCGGVTYAIGFTTKEYFKRGQNMSKEELGRAFKTYFQEGKTKVREQKEG